MMSMEMDVNASALTYEDLLLLPDDGQRHEMIGGEHYGTPSPGTVHQRFLRRLSSVLDIFVTGHRLGEILFAPFDVLLSSADVVEPDLLFVGNRRRSRLTDKNIEGAPDLVVDVISESTRRIDKKIKLRLYESSDVVECRLADPVIQTIEAYGRN